jgi:hypothetical protein
MNGVERDFLLRRSFAPAPFWNLRRVGSKSARSDQSNAKEVQSEKKHLREKTWLKRVYLAEVATDARRDTKQK